MQPCLQIPQRCLTLGDIWRITGTSNIPTRNSCACSAVQKPPYECATKEDLEYMLEGASKSASSDKLVYGKRIFMNATNNLIPSYYCIDNGSMLRIGFTFPYNDEYSDSMYINVRLDHLAEADYFPNRVYNNVRAYSSLDNMIYSSLSFEVSNNVKLTGKGTACFYFEVDYSTDDDYDIQYWYLDEGELNVITSLMDSIQEHCTYEMIESII